MRHNLSIILPGEHNFEHNTLVSRATPYFTSIIRKSLLSSYSAAVCGGGALLDLRLHFFLHPVVQIYESHNFTICIVFVGILFKASCRSFDCIKQIQFQTHVYFNFVYHND